MKRTWLAWGSKLKRTLVSFMFPCPRPLRSRLSRFSLLESVACRCRTLSCSCFLPFTNWDISFVKSGWNFKNEAQAIPSWTIPSCHMKAANTARMHSATDGDNACSSRGKKVLCQIPRFTQLKSCLLWQGQNTIMNREVFTILEQASLQKAWEQMWIWEVCKCI